jgi:hypothetical protein
MEHDELQKGFFVIMFNFCTIGRVHMFFFASFLSLYMLGAHLICIWIYTTTACMFVFCIHVL